MLILLLRRGFFSACDDFQQTRAVIGNYASVYDWIAYSIIKGARKPNEVRAFAEKVYNGRKLRQSVVEDDEQEEKEEEAGIFLA